MNNQDTVTAETEAGNESGRDNILDLPDEAAQIESHWNQLLTLPNAKHDLCGRNSTVSTLHIKGIGPRFNFTDLYNDPHNRCSHNPEGQVDLHRWSPGCLYLTIFDLTVAKRVLWRHRLTPQDN